MEQINVAIVDDQVLFRHGIASILHSDERVNLMFEAGDGIEALKLLEQQGTCPHVILVDIEMPRMDGMELVVQLQKQFPLVRSIMLSVHDAPRLIARAIHSGASGYLLKNCGKEELLQAIRATHTSGFYINATTLKAMQQTPRKEISYKSESGIDIEISPREKEVLQMICEEMTNTEIAEKLFVSPRTIDGHRNNLLHKTGCRNTAGLVLFAVKHHIYDIHS